MGQTAPRRAKDNCSRSMYQDGSYRQKNNMKKLNPGVLSLGTRWPLVSKEIHIPSWRAYFNLLSKLGQAHFHTALFGKYIFVQEGEREGEGIFTELGTVGEHSGGRCWGTALFRPEVQREILSQKQNKNLCRQKALHGIWKPLANLPVMIQWRGRHIEALAGSLQEDFGAQEGPPAQPSAKLISFQLLCPALTSPAPSGFRRACRNCTALILPDPWIYSSGGPK